MNGCDYIQLIKGREQTVVTHGIIVLLALFHCMVRYGSARHGSVRYGTAQFGSVCISTAV